MKSDIGIGFLVLFLTTVTLVAAQLQTCASVATANATLPPSVVSAIVACPNMARCVADACGISKLNSTPPVCADYDRGCLERAAQCFFAQLTNGSSEAALAGDFCYSWAFNGTKVLTSDGPTRQAACMQISCGALAQYGYSPQTWCSSNTSRSGLTNYEWATSCGVIPPRLGSSTAMYLALPICMHALALVLFIVAFAFAADADDGFLVILVSLVFFIVLFFAGIGIAGLMHRPLYGGTSTCNALSAATAMRNSLSPGTAVLQSFFTGCDSSHVEILGYRGAKSAEKCCVPKPPAKTNFTCDAISIVPDLSDDPLVVSDNVQRGLYAKCCPSLAGNTVPVGFAAMAVSAAFGVLTNVLLNVFSLTLLPPLKKCAVAAYNRIVRCCCQSWETDVESAQDSQTETNTHEFLAMCLMPSIFGMVKLVVSLVINVIAAAENVKTAPSGSSTWYKYTIYVASMVNGSFLANLSDLFCTAFVFTAFRHACKSDDEEKADNVMDILEEIAPLLGLAAAAVLLPFFITHWITGFLAFLPMIAAFAAILCVVVPIVFWPITRFSDERASSMSIPAIIILVIATFASCLLVNMILLQAARFPVNWAMMLYGDTSYPYFVARPDASTTTRLADFYGAMFHVPFYFLQMS